jgi:hypothetical protein
MEKTCIECKAAKDILLFIKNRNLCKDCMKEYKKNYHINNIEFIKKKKREYYIQNKDSILNRVSDNYHKDKDKKLKYQKEYTKKNKDKISKYKMEYQNRRRKNDPIFKLKYVISRAIRNSLRVKGLSKSKKSMDILGCDIIFFKNYIEDKFTSEMNWDNYGIVWDIDHIIPLSTALTEEDVVKLNHYTNLQPLDSYINRNIKRDRVDFY